jgi:hypothetical protein
MDVAGAQSARSRRRSQAVLDRKSGRGLSFRRAEVWFDSEVSGDLTASATSDFRAAAVGSSQGTCNVLVICLNGCGRQIPHRIVAAGPTDAADARLCAPTPAEAH